MHDGEVATLSDAIRHHYAASDTQTDLRLKQVTSGAEVADLVAFLETLTDQSFIENPAFALPKPGCPEATDDALVAQEDNSTRLHNSPQ
jgi:cytochrome c peroxidase